MTTITAMCLDGAETVIDSEAFTEFETGLYGTAITPGSGEYEAARKVWNGMIDKRPALIVSCSGVSDVVNTVKFARERDLMISLRGGAHSIAGHGTCDGGIVIDLSNMKGVRVDPGNKTAHAQAGLTWAELDNETLVHGLATPGGTVSNTGIAGLTLGGGLGWLMGKHGLSCDNVISFDVVTVDGDVVTADQQNHPDLYWALKGGGGNFGVVTSFQFQLHAVGPLVHGGMILHPMSNVRDAMRFYRDTTENSPDELEFYMGLMTSPDGDPVAGFMVGYNGDIDKGEQVIKSIREFGSPLVDMVQPMPYSARQHMLDDSAPHGPRRYWKSGFVRDFSDDVIDVFAEHSGNLISPMTAIPIFNFHGAAARVAPEATAFPHRSHQWDIDIVSQWLDPADDERQVEWTRQFWNDLEPFAGDTIYMNHLSADEPSRVESAFGSNFLRLQQVKRDYDPDNVFRLNHNIPPA